MTKNHENIAKAIDTQAAPLFEQGAEEVFAAMCCQKTYVGPPPERDRCSLCGERITVVRWPRNVPASEVAALL